jgi:CRISPR-associated protein Csm1
MTKNQKFLPLKALSLPLSQETIFPTAETQVSQTAYAALWAEFSQAARSLSEQNWTEAHQNAYLVGLLDLMQRYTWCVPARYALNGSDVSLYDHSRMTAALAACLVSLPSLPDPEGDEPATLLVGGDISGVQRFIYTITSSGAAKSLRGRSFYLQLLTEVVAHYVLDQLGLPRTNLLYAGGGNFFLLGQVGQEQKLDQITREISQKLLTTHDGDLHLILAYSRVKAEQFKEGQFYKAWDKLHEVLNQKKLKPLADLDEDVLTQVLGRGLGVGGDEDRICAICGREDDRTKPKDSGGDTVRTCRLCESFEELGNKLVKATHLITLYAEPRPHARIERWWYGLELFGVNFWPVNANEAPEEDQYVKLNRALHLIDVAVLKPDARYSQTLEQELAQRKAPQLQTLRLFTQLVPQNKRGYPLTFDELAEMTESYGRRWSGLERWGVLRMDVDNLGTLFGSGFQSKQNDHAQASNSLTLARLTALSFALRLFFEGWLPELGKATQANKRLLDRLYVQYAGGDDLFVVGSWDALPEFALAIQESFAEYVGHNPAVTLSGGVSLATIKYPLYQAADDAEKAEKAAKQFREGKNAFCFLGQVVGWEDFRQVMERAYQLAGWCDDNGPVSRALLQNLMSIHREYREGRDKAIKHKKWQPGQTYWGPWMWHLAYQMARRIESKQIPEPIKEELRKLEKAMLDSPHNIETIGLAARWAQFLIRS